MKIPSVRNMYGGLMFAMLGLLMLNGGGIGVRVFSDGEPIWVNFPQLDAFVCWLVVWLGIDEAIFSGKASRFIVNKTIAPIAKSILGNIFGEDRLKGWASKLDKLDKAEVIITPSKEDT